MTEPLKLKRDNGYQLSVKKDGSRYNVVVTGGPNLTPDELAKVEAYIGSDPDGQVTLAKLRARG